MSGQGFAISDLRKRPDFGADVADRVWQAWWRGRGYRLDHIVGRVRENLNAEPIPFALVAHDGDRFLGTASVVASDLTERPQYTPWVAAVWVDPDFRSRGVGSALVRRAVHATFAAGFHLAYLCALPDRRSFYEGLGWKSIEEGVGKAGLTVLTCAMKPEPKLG